jgi:hypothetical protein
MGKRKWTVELVFEKTAKCKTRSEVLADQQLYKAAKRLGVYEKAVAHIPTQIRYFTDNDLLKFARKFKTPSEAASADASMYALILRRGLKKKAFDHMKDTRIRTFHSDAEIMRTAKKCSYKAEFRNNHSDIYQSAKRKGLLTAACAHMPKDTRGKWTDAELFQRAKKYKTAYEFRRYDNSAYSTAWARGILERVCGHMEAGWSGFDRRSPAILYYLRITKGSRVVWKIGITNRTVKERFVGENRSIKVVKEWRYKVGDTALKREQLILKQHKRHAYKGPALLKSTGVKEMFSIDVLGLDALN